MQITEATYEDFCMLYLTIKMSCCGITELLILSRGQNHFVDVHPEFVIQHDVNT